MPFIALVKEGFLNNGISALDYSVSYDQKLLLKENINFIKPLDLEFINIVDAAEAPENIRNEVCPGKPVPEFVALPNVNIYLKAPQSSKCLLSQNIPIYEGDNKDSIINRLRRTDKNYKPLTNSNTKFYRHNDIVLGPRRIPVPLPPSQSKSDQDISAWASKSKVTEIAQAAGDGFKIVDVKDRKYVQSGKDMVGEEILMVVRE